MATIICTAHLYSALIILSKKIRQRRSEKGLQGEARESDYMSPLHRVEAAKSIWRPDLAKSGHSLTQIALFL